VEQHPQSWLHNTLGVWLGYFLTALAAIPASAFGLFLTRNGLGPNAGILVSISLAVLGGFVAEHIVAMWSLKRTRLVVPVTTQIGYQLNWRTSTVTAASFVLVATGMPTRPTATTLPEEPAIATSAPLLVRAR
jgi:hypothetical protein